MTTQGKTQPQPQPQPQPQTTDLDTIEQWREELIYQDGSNRLVNNSTNVMTLIMNHSQWKGQAWTDTLAHRRMRSVNNHQRPWTDKDSQELLEWVHKNGMPNALKSTVEDGLSMASSKDERNPLVEYLCTVEWDGTSRVNTWLTDYLGANSTPLNSAIGRAWLISAVARAMQPGCQADHCLILEGKQGLKKSTLLRDLAGEEYHAEHSAINLADKDAAITLTGKWIIEFSELGAVKSNRVETVKSFLTRRADHYRPPYGRHAVTIPRSCVFAGTTNEEHYLDDQTGNRRYWPVKCYHASTRQLARDRDQLWAEAYNLYECGELWYLSPTMEKLAKYEQQRRVNVDAWLEYVESYVRNKPNVSIPDILIQKFEKSAADISVTDTKRVAACLRSLGWESYKTNDGKCLNRWKPSVVNRRASLNPDRAEID